MEHLKVAIMCNGLVFPRWQAEAIRYLLSSKEVECTLLIKDARSAERGGRRRREMLRRLPFKNYLWLAYSWLLKKRSTAAQPVDLIELLGDVPVLEATVHTKGKFSEYFADHDVEQIKHQGLDVIIRFSFGIIRGDILEAARYGVWSFHHGDEQKYRGGPPGFWEIYRKEAVTGAILQRLTNKLDAGVILKKGFLKTKRSYRKNRDQLFLESARWPAQVCLDIRYGNADYLNERPSATEAPIYYLPTNSRMIGYGCRYVTRTIAALYHALFYLDFWNIGLVKAPVTAFLEEQKPAEVEWFPLKGTGRFAADPFGVQGKEGITVLFEEFPFNSGKGRIRLTCYTDHGFTGDDLVLEEPFHLSYPFLVQYGEEIALVPETWESGEVRMYRGDADLRTWHKEQTLIERFAGVDNTLLYHNGRWWLFAMNKHDGVHYHLHLFYADTPSGEWKAHPKNPVKTDIRSARPAGPLFMHNGQLFRPAMDYAEKIEGRIVINRVVVLSETDFREEIVRVIDPYAGSPFPDKIHTLCGVGEYTLIDGCRELFVPWHPGLWGYKIKTLLGRR